MSTSSKSKDDGGTRQADGRHRVAELHEQVAEGVAALVGSDAWRAMLDTAAKFHTYSLGNVLLIALQAPQARRDNRSTR